MVIRIEGNPRPYQSVRFTRKGIAYKSKEAREHADFLKRTIQAQVPEDHELWDGPIIIQKATFCFTHPKSWSKKKVAELESGVTFYKDTKPDLHDNLFKAVIDAMEGIIFTNDSRIVKLESAQKIWGIVGYTEISLLNSIN
tara:strand:- start:217 stop:639 length:423 start_codon:yes stop_codon:yes gene_type:complete